MRAREIGRRHKADIVVWGTAMCVKNQGCAQPVFTVVEPESLSQSAFAGGDVVFDPLNPSRALTEGHAADPMNLARALLGRVSYKAQKYGDAAFYFSGLAKGAIQGINYYEALRDLGQSQYFLGRIEHALHAAVKLENEARRDGDGGWAPSASDSGRAS
mgnify:CR=1 FL=1